MVSFDAHARVPSAETDELSRLAILNRTIIHVRENYVDPSRIDVGKMAIAALEQVQAEVDEFIVDRGTSNQDVPRVVTIRVGENSQTFKLDDVQNLWTLAFKLKDIFRFLLKHRPAGLKSRNVEYAINGPIDTRSTQSFA